MTFFNNTTPERMVVPKPYAEVSVNTDGSYSEQRDKIRYN